MQKDDEQNEQDPATESEFDRDPPKEDGEGVHSEAAACYPCGMPSMSRAPDLFSGHEWRDFFSPRPKMFPKQLFDVPARFSRAKRSFFFGPGGPFFRNRIPGRQGGGADERSRFGALEPRRE